MVAITGGRGFLGWHVRALGLARGLAPFRRVPVGLALDGDSSRAAVDGCERLLHLAGVNRGSDDDVRDGNVLFARQLADAVTTAEAPPTTVVFADSVQAGNGTAYGEGKARAADLLQAAADRVGAEFVDLRLPNLFGEHGRPDHNSVVATFCDRLASGRRPHVEVDRPLDLLSAQKAAEFVLGERAPADLASAGTRRRVSEVLAELVALDAEHHGASMPALDGDWRRDLFNALRSATFAHRPTIDLAGRTSGAGRTGGADERGAFHEIVRTTGGAGQTSFSTTVPGVVRGQHFHRRKVERFCVVGGDAVIRLRRVLTDDVLEIPVSGDHPVAVDIPTLWAHSLVAVGDRPVQTLFWVDEPFDPTTPDTFQEDV